MASETGGAGSDGATDGDFLAAFNGLREKEIGDVDATDEQDGSGGGEKKHQASARLAGDLGLERDERSEEFEFFGSLAAEVGLEEI